MSIPRPPAFLAAIASFSFASLAMADQPPAPPAVPQPLDIKPGLWEVVKVTTVVNHQNLDQMFSQYPPAQRDKIIADIRAQENKPHPNTQKGNLCLPKQEQAIMTLIVYPANDCTRTGTSSDHGSDMHVVCPAKTQNNAPISALVEQSSHFQRIDAENFTGTISAHESSDALKMNADLTFTAHWLRDTCGPAPLPPGQAVPISVSTARIGNRYEIHIQNQTAQPVTAYAFQLAGLGGQSSTRFVDARLDGGQPMKPHGGAAQYLPDGLPVATGAVTAGVFADGTAVGEPKTLAELMGRRLARLRALKAIAAILCDSERKAQDPGAVIKILQSPPPYTDPSNIAMLSNVYVGTFVGMAERLKHGSGAQPLPSQHAT
ncbi:MAG: DUF3617 family protein, partial [Steroidobacteraceae bacterium]